MKRVLTSLLGVLVACGGATTDNADGGVDASTPDVTHPPDAALVDASAHDVSTTLPYDGTTGKTCAKDGDCWVPNGPQVARCSSSVFAPQDYYPTPVCILPSCDPVSDTKVHYCDGPDDPSSPGICVPGFSGGVCVPKCNYDKKGSPPVGCQGKDACFSYTLGATGGVGYCFGGCTKDGDCQNGQKCQTDTGYCMAGVVPPTKPVGAACTSKDTTNGVCNCLYGTAKTGYCSSFCIVGGPACPQGFVCDSIEYRAYGFSTQNTGMAGYCMLDCSSDAGACPSSATCTNALAGGPDCVPP